MGSAKMNSKLWIAKFEIQLGQSDVWKADSGWQFQKQNYI